MTEISNRTLAALLVVAIVISIGGAILTVTQVTNLVNIIPALSGITGLGSTGRVNVSVLSLAQFTVAQPNAVDFGVGYVVAQNFAVLNSSNSTPAAWTVSGTTWAAKDLSLENTGSVYLNISVESGSTAATMIGGGAGAIPDPAIKFAPYNNESGSCASAGGSIAALTSFAAASTKYKVCENFSYQASENSLNVTIELLIPGDVATGNKTAQLTFTAVQSPGAV
ncbi:hypothetical protein J4433_01095 [Candidatus Pacearchaeota archaeon]|nr:hypothetical protein [Candidatus Pacearchaeota archaeon]